MRSNVLIDRRRAHWVSVSVCAFRLASTSASPAVPVSEPQRTTLMPLSCKLWARDTLTRINRTAARHRPTPPRLQLNATHAALLCCGELMVSKAILGLFRFGCCCCFCGRCVLCVQRKHTRTHPSLAQVLAHMCALVCVPESLSALRCCCSGALWPRKRVSRNAHIRWPRSGCSEYPK